MRELTGYEDRHGLPILEGDIVKTEPGCIDVVEEISEGWYPFCILFESDAWEPEAVEVLGSVYTSDGRKLLAECGIPWMEE
jgi:hypothetical protein